jgi:hypothetical protein
MSRDNQGLQVSLIIFVMLTMTVGVTAFVMFRKYDEATFVLRQKDAELEQARSVHDRQRADIERLKQVIGVPPTASMQTIDEQLQADVSPLGATDSGVTLDYRAALALTRTLLQDQSARIVQQGAEIERAEQRSARLVELAKLEAERQRSAVDEAGKSLLTVYAGAKADGRRMASDNENLRTAMASTRSELELALHDVQRQLDTADRARRALAAENADLKAHVERLTAREFRQPQGTLVAVNYRLKTAWIDMGRANDLTPSEDFTVYGAEVASLGPKSAKGRIEVGRVLGEHLATAHIVDDRIKDPMIPGDKIHSPRRERP